MSDIINSPNMGLTIPVTGVDPGPDYANNVNGSFTTLDGHDHSPGKGVAITPAGININAALSFNGFDITGLRSSRYNNQTSVLNSAADLGCVYVSGGNLYYNNTSGTPVQITSGSSIVGTAGSIIGLPSGTASASYTGGTFVWQSATNTAANMDLGSAILRNATASSHGLTLQPPAAMATDYSITLPSLPPSTKLVTMDTSGNLTASVTGDGSTIGLSSAQLSVLNGAITYAKLAPSGIMGSNSLTFTASGTFVAPTNVNSIYVDMWGGGGGGGNSTATVGGGGGSGGARFKGFIPVVAGTTYTINVSGGYVAGAATNGGTSRITTPASVDLAIAQGGLAGGSAPGSSTGGNNGLPTWTPIASGGNGSGGTTGGNGNSTEYASGGAGGTANPGVAGGGGGGGAGFLTGANGGAGGSAILVNGGQPGSVLNSGSGGGGGAAAQNGGAGQAGMVTIYWAGPTLGN